MKSTGIAWGIVAMVALAGCSRSGDESKVVASSPSSADANLPPDRRTTHIVCYAGNEAVYVGDSTPEMQPSFSDSSVGFRDAKTGHYMRITGTCVVTYQD